MSISHEERDFWQTARRNLIERQAGRLVGAFADLTGHPTSNEMTAAFLAIARECGPRTIDTLVNGFLTGDGNTQLDRELVEVHPGQFKTVPTTD